MAAVGRGGRASRSGTPRAAKTDDGHQDVGGESRPTYKASDDEGVGDIVANPGVQDRRKDVRDHAQDGKSDGTCGQDKRRDVLGRRRRSAGQVDEGSGESHDSRHGRAARRPPAARRRRRQHRPRRHRARAPPAPHRLTATKRSTKISTKTTASTEVAIAVPRDSEWTARELAQVRAQLVAQLSEMQSEYNQSLIELDELQSSSTDGAGDDQADAGSKTFEREQELSIAANRLDLLTQIKRAVERIDAGTYGYCESCGKPIPKARLKAFPMATLDVACKQREERR